MDELPQDIIFKILSILPLKSVLKLKCVSKSWSRIIDNPSNMQIQYSQPLIIPDFNVSRNTITLYAAVETEEDMMIHAGKNPMAKLVELVGFCAHGSCNGLLYFAEYRQRGVVVVSNPLRNQFRVLPPVDFQCYWPNMKGFGLGFDDSTKNFKMVCTYFRDSSYELGAIVHNFGTRSWKEISKGPRYLMYGKPVFVHGSLHWMVSPFFEYEDLESMIVSFNVSKEEFELIPHPEFHSKDRKLFELFDLNGDLAMVDLSCNRKIEIWAMDYEKKEWSIKYSIGMTAPVGEDDNGGIEVIGIWKHGEILMKSYEGYWIYSKKSGGLKYKQISGFDSSAVISCYRGSLISMCDAM